MNQRGKAVLRRLQTCMPALVLLFVSACCNAQGLLPGTLLVRLTPGSSIAAIAQDYGLFVLDSVSGRNVFEVMAQDQNSEFATVLFLNFDSRVQYCEPEPSVNSPEFQATPFHIAFGVSPDSTAYTSQTAYQQVDLGNSIAGTTGTGNSSSNGGSAATPVVVAVLDTGVDLSNAVLAGRLLPGYNAVTPGTSPADKPDGVNNTVVGHGTMISGLIARTSPDSTIMPIRVFNADGTGSMIHVLKGINYAVRHGAAVINMSFETATNSVALADALDEAYSAGVVLVASAGNDSTSAPRYPAANPLVIGVASVESDDTLSPYSNFGVNASLVAPGSDIRSTYWNGYFATWSGTSFAAPFVAAEAAEVLATNPGWSPSQVTNTMLATANNIDYLNPGYAFMLGAGIIDFQAAIEGQ